MKKNIEHMEFCDVCHEDGEEVVAVAIYLGDEDTEYAACEDHFKLVREANLPVVTMLN